MNITIRTTTRTDDKTGREITRFTPYLTLRPYGTGEISLGAWDAWSNKREDIECQRTNAEQSATRTIREISAELAQMADSLEYPETDLIRELEAAR